MVASPKKPNFLRTEHDIMFYDTDAAGVVHNLAYLRYIEYNRTKLAEVLRLDIVKLGKQNIYPALVSAETKYLRPAKLYDRLVITGYLEKVEAARFWCVFRVENSEQNILFCHSKQALVLIKKYESENGEMRAKPLRLPKAWQKARPSSNEELSKQALDVFH